MFNLKKHDSPINYRSHGDILREYSQQIQSTFEQVGGIAPSLGSLSPSTHWRYCQTINKKDKKKIGYICEFGETRHSKPYVRITVNNFKLGSSTFKSLSEDENDQPHYQKPYLRPLPSFDRAAIQKSDESEARQKNILFQQKLALWKQASTDTASHSYAQKKQLRLNPHLRQTGNNLIYPLIHSETNQIVGIQTIDEQGNKRIYGKKQKAYAILGDLDAATTIYLCEGYATANAVEQLAPKEEPFAVINALDAQNLVLIAEWIKSRYFSKKIIIAADNDEATASEGKGNAGLWYGLDAAIKTQSILRFPENTSSEPRNIDWCDAWIENQEQAKQAFRQKKSVSLKTFTLERLQYAPLNVSRETLGKAINTILKSFLHSYPIEMTENALLDKVYAVAKPFNIAPSLIKSQWIQLKKRTFAKALRPKTFPLSSTSNRYTVTEFATLTEIANHVAQLKAIYPKAIFITNAPMGTGKTQQFMKPHFKCDTEQNRLPVIITPTRALTKSIAERFHASHYQKERTDFEQTSLPTSLAITINSIIRTPFDVFLDKSQSIFIDEFTQVLRAMISGTVQNESRQQTHRKLTDLIRDAHYTYIADADLNAIALDEIIHMAQDNTPIFVMTLPKQDNASYLYRFHHYKKTRLAMPAFQQTIEEALEVGERLYIVSDSRKKLNELQERLKKQSLNVLMINAEFIRTQKAQVFLDNPDDYLQKEQPDVVMVSPAVQSGLSIESTYFNRVFGIYTGTVTPTVFNQMLNRVRAPIPREIVLPNQKPHGQHHLENPDALLTASYEHYLTQFGSQYTVFNPITRMTQIGRLTIQRTEQGVLISGDEHYEHFERLSADIKAMDYQQRNHAGSFLVLQSMALRFTIDIQSHALNIETKQALKKEEKEIQAAVIASRQKALCGINILSQDEYIQRKNKGADSIEEIYAMQRFEIADSLHIHEVKPDDLTFFDEQGIDALNNFDDFNNPIEHAHCKDETEQNNTVSKGDATWCKTKVALLHTLFSVLNLDKETGLGYYHKTTAATARNTIRQDEALSRYVHFKLKLAMNSNLSDVAWVNKILAKLLSLKTERVQIREGQGRVYHYAIASGFQRLKAYREQRYSHIEGCNEICHQK